MIEFQGVKYMASEDVCKMLKRSSATISIYSKNGYLVKKKFFNRTFFTVESVNVLKQFNVNDKKRLVKLPNK